MAAKINSKYVCTRGRCFSIFQYYINFDQNHVRQGQFQQFQDFISYNCFLTEDILDKHDSKNIDIH